MLNKSRAVDTGIKMEVNERLVSPYIRIVFM